MAQPSVNPAPPGASSTGDAHAARETVLLAIARAEAPGPALAAVAGLGHRIAWLTPAGEVEEALGLELTPADLPLIREGAEGEHVRTQDGSELLVVRLSGGGRLVLAPVVGGDLPEAAEIGRDFDRVLARGERLRELDRELSDLRQRAEESEALHVLGLTANRTLDSGDVVNLVARFTRSLLGGHYVTVSVREDGRVRTLKSAGVHSPGFPDPDPLGEAVIAAGKPLVVPPSPATMNLEPHAAEGMMAALGVPMSLYGESIGALVVGYRRGYQPSGRDVRLALTLAGHAAVALHNARLHGELAARTEELERAYGELRWSTEAKERFFATLSHELRTPLNSTLGYLDLVLDEIHGPVPAALRTPLKNASRAAKGLLHLVSDVLDLAKMDAGKIELSFRPSRIAAVVREAAATVQPLASARGLSLEVTIDDSLPLIETDPDRVRQILINLLSNAVKFTPEGEVRVFLRRRESVVEIAVVDTGVGVAPENQERIFHEFEQVSDMGTGGTGLGLPISRKLARLLGGDVHLVSSQGNGSTFTLELPLRKGTAVAR